MKIFMAIYMPRRKRTSSQENAHIIEDIVLEQENEEIFYNIDPGDIPDDTGDISELTDRQNPIFDPYAFPGIRWNPRRGWGFPRAGLPQDIQLNEIALISLGIFYVSGMAYSLLPLTAWGFLRTRQ
jgi:hypothetical protein